MAILSPKQRQIRTCLIISLVLLVALIVVGGGILAFISSLPIHLGNTPNPSIGIGTLTEANGEQIGISDGSYAFDVNRPDGDLKRQASDRFKQGDRVGAQSLWKQAVSKETNDAEALIYLEDQRVRDSGKSYVILVVGTMLTGDSTGTGHDDLQGAYVAQQQYNNGFLLGGSMQVVFLVASAGSKSDYAALVAQQIVQAAKQDHRIVGVMGWPFSAYAANSVSVLANAHIPMVSQTASSDALTGISPFFFRVAPSNKSQAIAGAQYAIQQLHATRIVLFTDPTNSYTKSLADDFRQQFPSGGSQIVAEKNYTVGKPENLPALLQDALSVNPDLIYFAGYASDMSVLLTDFPASQPNLQLMGGDALYELSGYNSSGRAGFSHLHFTAFTYPDEWGILGLNPPPFFKTYASDFDPDGSHQANPYGFSRPDNDTILSYDAMLALLEASKNALTGGKTSLTSDMLQQSLEGITGPGAIQGVGGQIAFGRDGDPVNKAIVVLFVDPDGHIKVTATNGVQGCFQVGKC